MTRMRITLALTFAVVFGILALTAVTQQLPLKQDVEILKQAPMHPEKVKEGLYIIRGPALPCMVGCKPGETGDGLIHESGAVAVRENLGYSMGPRMPATEVYRHASIRSSRRSGGRRTFGF